MKHFQTDAFEAARREKFVRVSPKVNHPLIQDVLWDMEHGAARRAAIVEALKHSESGRVYVNRRYCVILKKDADFRQLIKKGILVLGRSGLQRSRHSFVTLAP